MALIRQWTGAASQTVEESVSAEDLLSVVEASHESIVKKLSDCVSNATALRRAEEQLKTLEHSREAHDVNRDALLKQLQVWSICIFLFTESRTGSLVGLFSVAI
jgi:hypothetical protein